MKTMKDPSKPLAQVTQSICSKGKNKKRYLKNPGKKANKPKSTPKQVTTSTKCNGCGSSHLRSKCPFRDASCHKCSKKGYIAKVCRSSSTVDQLATESSTDQPAIQSITSADNRRHIFISASLAGKNVQFQFDSRSDVTTVKIPRQHINVLKIYLKCTCWTFWTY